MQQQQMRVTDSEIIEVFDLFDTDGSGTISAEEVLFAVKALCPSKSAAAALTLGDAAEMIRKAGGKSELTAPQFVSLCRNTVPSCNSPEEAVAAFRLFDRNARGRLTRDDLLKACEDVCGPVADAAGVSTRAAFIDRLLLAADQDKDRAINLDEWRRVVERGGSVRI